LGLGVASNQVSQGGDAFKVANEEINEF